MKEIERVREKIFGVEGTACTKPLDRKKQGILKGPGDWNIGAEWRWGDG